MLQGEGVWLSYVSASGRAHFMHSSSNSKISLPTIADILGLKVRQVSCVTPLHCSNSCLQPALTCRCAAY